MTQISHRLTFNQKVFKIDQDIFDCEVVTKTGSYKCQRLFLAAQSKWFEDYFTKNPSPFVDSNGKPVIQRIQINVDPNGYFHEVLTLLYEGHGIITAEKIPPFLKIADYYGIPSLQSALRIMYQEPIKGHGVNEDNLKTLMKEFVDLGLIDDAKLLAPSFAERFEVLLLNPFNPPNTNLTKEDIYAALSPQVFATVLHDKDLREKAIGNEARLVSIIDEYVAYRKLTITSVADQEALASCINWNVPDAYKYLLSNKCDWLPTRISRPLLKTIITQRSHASQYFKDFTKNPPAKISHWYPFVWCDKVAKADGTKANPVVQIASFVSTLGNLVPQFNPHVFGYIKVFATLHSINDDLYDPRFILEKNGGYLSLNLDDHEEPAIGYDLGDEALFLPTKCTYGSGIQRRNVVAQEKATHAQQRDEKQIAKRFRTPCPARLHIISSKDTNHFDVQEVNIKNPDETLQDFKELKIKPSRALGIKQPASTDGINRLLGVRSLEFEGTFLLQ